MPGSKFVYVTYMRTTPEKLWDALTKPEFNTQYWWPDGMHQESGWKKGSAWRLVFSDGRVADSGTVLEIDPPRRLVLRWHNEISPELMAEGDSRCTFTLEREGELVKLTVTHEGERMPKMIEAVSLGWPRVLSSLKSFLETGAGMPHPNMPPKG